MSDRISGIIREYGRAGANAIFPEDIEFYAVTLELVDSNGDTVEYITFPINPEAISYDNTSLVAIKQTAGGITAIDTDAFVPINISMNGTFGRTFKVLLSPPTDKAIDSSPGTGLSFKSSIIDAKLKTGYGATKLLEKIVVKSRELDNYGKPFKLFLYLPMAGHSFLIKVKSFKMSQDEQSSNMMWKYGLDIIAIAPLNKVRIEGFEKGSVFKSTSFSILQKTATGIANNLIKSVF